MAKELKYEFHLQDPTSPETVYLFEAIVGAVQGAVRWRGIFAFVTRNAVDTLISDPIVDKFLRRAGKFSLLVGIDAVTNRPTLERLQELEKQFWKKLQVQVFWNESGGLFHPKIFHFEYPDGRQTIIVGSGNLTPGGFRENFEAYSILRSAAGEKIDLSSWDTFLEVHKVRIRSIDDKALERAGRNFIRVGRGRRRSTIEPELIEAAAEQVVATRQKTAPSGATDRVLVAQVPRAGGRWNQVHFNQDIVQEYFRVQPNTDQRVYLTEKRLHNSVGDEEVRPCIYSKSNKNYKIELAAKARHGIPESPAHSDFSRTASAFF